MNRSFLSRLDEGDIFGRDFTLVCARNATLVLEDTEGRRAEYLDFMSAYGAVNFGHCNPEIRPFQDAPADLAACFYPPEAERFARWLCGRLGTPEHSVLFQVGGSFAVSTALALAQRARPGKVLAVCGSFHGLGADSLSATTTHRRFALQDTELLAGLAGRMLHLTPGDLPESWDGISCFLYETVQGANGYTPLDSRWLLEVEHSARRAGVLTIADEIQCGFFRHGCLSPARRHGLNPHILLYGKSMTNGLHPISAVVYHRSLEPSLDSPVVLAHTFQTAALGFYAAMAVARFLDSHPMEPEASRVGEHMQDLASRLQRSPAVSEIHRTGPTLSFAVAGGGAREVVRRGLRHQAVFFTGGPHGERVRVAPPLTIPDEQLARGTQVLLQLLAELEPHTRPLSAPSGASISIAR